MSDDPKDLTEAIYGRMFDCNVRIQKAWPMPCSPAPDGLIEVIRDGLDSGEGNPPNLPAVLLPYFEKLTESELDAFFDNDMEAIETLDDLCGWLFRQQKFGWLGVAATPAMTRLREGSDSYSFWWGNYWTELLFADSADGLLTAAADWAEARHAEDMAKVVA